jgi:F0F1-type ATP synthase membrane subunit c/vacuolar-type H+-ATPase subunit K
VDSGATQTTFLTLMHLTFVIMNTLLMLNLLIAMMVRK